MTEYSEHAQELASELRAKAQSNIRDIPLSVKIGVPHRVIQKTVSLGIHPFCIVSGANESCQFCYELMMMVYTHFYEHLQYDLDQDLADEERAAYA